MFTAQHFVWLLICFIISAVCIVYLYKKKPPMQTVLTVACVICVLSELVKTFSMMQMIPSSNGKRMYLYLEMQHLPFHLCSIQILLIFYARFTENIKKRTSVLAFLYPTGVLGSFFALVMPTIFKTNIKVSQAFTHPLAYQFFLYHTMLLVLGAYIAFSGQVDIRPKHYLTTLGLLGGLSFVSLYLNSIFAAPVYKNNKLVSVEYSPNYFFTYRTPVGIKLTEMWHWAVYLVILTLLAVLLIGLFYFIYFKIAGHGNKKTH